MSEKNPKRSAGLGVWVASPGVKKSLRVSALISLVMLAGGVALNIWGDEIWFPHTLFMGVLGLLIGAIGVSAALWLWIGMGIFWLYADALPRGKRGFWFFVLLLLNWAGAVLYYFSVYLRAEKTRFDSSGEAGGAPLNL